MIHFTTAYSSRDADLVIATRPRLGLLSYSVVVTILICIACAYSYIVFPKFERFIVSVEADLTRPLRVVMATYRLAFIFPLLSLAILARLWRRRHVTVGYLILQQRLLAGLLLLQVVLWIAYTVVFYLGVIAISAQAASSPR